jgi:hypothetical protein
MSQHETFKRIPHKCRICDISLELHQHEDCPEFTARTLSKMVVCDRCGEFRKKWWACEAKLKRLCLEVYNERCKRSPDDTMLGLCRERIGKAAREIAAITCDHYRLQFFWSDDFTAQLMEKPNMVLAILRVYERSVERMNDPLKIQAERLRTGYALGVDA